MRLWCLTSGFQLHTVLIYQSPVLFQCGVSLIRLLLRLGVELALKIGKVQHGIARCSAGRAGAARMRATRAARARAAAARARRAPAVAAALPNRASSQNQNGDDNRKDDRSRNVHSKPPLTFVRTHPTTLQGHIKTRVSSIQLCHRLVAHPKGDMWRRTD